MSNSAEATWFSSVSAQESDGETRLLETKMQPRTDLSGAQTKEEYRWAQTF